MNVFHPAHCKPRANKKEKIEKQERLYSLLEVKAMICLVAKELNASELIRESGLVFDGTFELDKDGVVVIVKKDNLLEKIRFLTGGV